MTDTTMNDTSATELEFQLTSTRTASTNADRQRRYRQRKSVTNASVTRDDRNALTVTSRVTDGDVTVLCASQDKIEITFNDDGDAIITQSRWPDEDHIIIVSRDNIPVFIDKLTDALGIGSFGRPG